MKTTALITVMLIFTAQLVLAQAPTWRIVGELATARTRHEAAVIGQGKILVFGGSTSADITNTVEIIDINRDVITPAESMNTPRAEFASLKIGDSMVLAIGGVNTNTTTASIEAYHIKSGTWSNYGSMIFPRRQFTALWVSPTEFMIVGGRGLNTNTVNTAEIFDITTKTSRRIADFPIYTNNPASGISSQGLPIVFGGREGGSGSNQSDGVYHYDTQRNTWAEIGKMTTFSEYPPTLKLWDGRLAYSGGNNERYRGTDWLNDVAIEENNTFRVLGRMQIGRHTHFIAQWDTTTLITGGGVNAQRHGYVTQQSTEWTDLATGTTIPGPMMNHPHGQAVSCNIIQRKNNQPVTANIVIISGFGENLLLTPVVEILEHIAPSPAPPEITSGGGDCRSHTFIITDPEGIVSLALDPNGSNNTDVSFTPQLPSDTVTVVVTLRDPTRPGTYSIRAVNSKHLSSTTSGTLSGGVQLFIQTTDAARGILDTAVVGGVKCRSVRITNPSSDSVEISRMFMHRNIEISLPGGARSALIPPYDSIDVTVCFAPTMVGLTLDTLSIEYPCAATKLPFEITAIPYNLQGEERCRIVVFADVYSASFTTHPYPNPASSAVTFTVSPFVRQVIVSDALGNTVTGLHFSPDSQRTFLLPTAAMPAGWYIFSANTGVSSENIPVFISP